MPQVQSSSLCQKSPNPGIEPNLSEVFAVVGGGKVGAASELMTQPISGEFSEVCFWNVPLTNLP